jgi:hypothetical protein
MKLKSILAAALLLSGFTAGTASADQWCSLSVNPSPYIQPGQMFSYGIDISGQVWPGPFPPNGNPGPPFTVLFFGSKNGVADIPPSGEGYPASFGYGHSELTGYGNPAGGGIGGVYERYAVIYSNSPVVGHAYCVTNPVYVVLFN